MEKQQIETYLRVNGLSLDSDTDEIKQLLQYSKWQEGEIDEQVEHLQENFTATPTQSQVAYRAIYTDGRLDPSMVRSILGVEMSVGDSDLTHNTNTQQLEPSSTQLFEIIAYSLLLAFMIVGVGFGIVYFDIALPV